MPTEMLTKDERLASEPAIMTVEPELEDRLRTSAIERIQRLR